ncbi:glycosyl hydrolase family 28-related protein [Leptothermofonsia sp. ETS-13]|uniref:glycosyl hydrolase family 28-related protein n=1 Tax=Leptothermofonsia sp. ETS-13 TaxID=3035696 RepID=UPI003BA2B06E
MPAPIRIEAENYRSGRGVGYYDTTTGNTGGVYRSDDVDVQRTSDVGGGYNVGWIRSGEWLTYDVTLPRSGTYNIVARVAAANSSIRRMSISVGGQTFAMNFTGTGGGQVWKDVILAGLDLNGGSQMVRLDMQTSNFNLNYIELIPINSENIMFPADAGVVDVRTYGAIPNDGQDDTAAIQRALDANPSGNRIIYFSNGVYDVSNTLRYSGTQKRNILQGQSRDGTIIKLKDFSGLNGPVIWTGNPPAQRFRNSILNLTVDVGVGNPTATGIAFIANNQGAMRDVKIISRDRKGAVGLDLGIDENGPTLIKDIEVVGFDVGIRTWNPTASQTLEHIRLSNQNQYGWKNYNQQVYVRDLQSTNAVTAIWNMPDGVSGFTLIDSTLTGVGATASTLPAIWNQKGMYVRNLTTSGYQLAIRQDDKGRGNPSQPNGYVNEWMARDGFVTLFGSPLTSMRLPISETPEVPWDALSNWRSPLTYGGLPNDGIDDTAAIQAAIDSGATTVYLPNGTWNLNGTIYLRGNVRRFLGTEAFISSNGNGVIEVFDGSSPTIVIERLEANSSVPGAQSVQFVHSSTRTLVLSSILGGNYRSTTQNPGDVYIEDVSGGPWFFKNQNVWARQINPEVYTPVRIQNDGGRLWILGYKDEDEGTMIETINGGKTELIGAYLLNGNYEDIPAFVNNESSLSFVGVSYRSFGGGSIPIGVKETRNGVTRTTNGLPGNYSGYIP